MGGVQEWLVRFGKKALHDLVQNKFLTEEALVIAIIEIEFLVNRRPLTAMSSGSINPKSFPNWQREP